MNIYVGNLARTVTEETLKEKFKEMAQANVASVRLIKDKFTGEPRGFGFLQVPDAEEAKRAIDTMNGFELEGRKLVVNEAREQERSPRPRFNGGGSGGGRGGDRDQRGGGGGGFGGFRPKRF